MAGTSVNKDFNSNSYDDVEHLAQIVRKSTRHRPTIGVVCGSGLGKIAQLLTEQDVLPYENLPNFPVSTVAGHAGRFVFGVLEGKTIVCMQGRVHPYEGYDLAKSALPIRLMKLLGIETLILTNAVGGLNAKYKTGDMVALKDHIFLPGLAGYSPLRGPNDDRFGPRFLTMANAYNRVLRKLALATAQEIGMNLHEGVYIMCGGPQFETPAENRFLRTLGGDVVGMSVAHETIVARHCGLNVMGLSLVTNLSVMKDNDDDDIEKTENSDVHAEVLEMGNQCADKACGLIRAIIKKLPVS
jgi:purine-nucleoside phosphorylase